MASKVESFTSNYDQRIAHIIKDVWLTFNAEVLYYLPDVCSNPHRSSFAVAKATPSYILVSGHPTCMENLNPSL